MMVRRKMIYVTAPLCRKAVLRSTGRPAHPRDTGLKPKPGFFIAD